MDLCSKMRMVRSYSTSTASVSYTHLIGVIGQERNYSDEIQDEAYLFIPFDEDYYQAMAKAVSYTHLDVYKRQLPFGRQLLALCWWAGSWRNSAGSRSQWPIPD